MAPKTKRPILSIHATLPEREAAKRRLTFLLKDDEPPRTRVFVCSPYAGCINLNVHNARMYSRFVFLCGCMPVTPHLMYPRFLDDRDPKERDAGIRMGFALLDNCAELWAFGDRISNGMRREIAFAESHGILVRYFSDTCKEVIKRGRA